MARQDPPASHSEKYEIEGHAVEIKTIGEREELWIDGKRHNFFVTRDGYTLHDDAYVRPAKSLQAAATTYLQRLTRERKPK